MPYDILKKKKNINVDGAYDCDLLCKLIVDYIPSDSVKIVKESNMDVGTDTIGSENINKRKNLVKNINNYIKNISVSNGITYDNKKIILNTLDANGGLNDENKYILNKDLEGDSDNDNEDIFTDIINLSDEGAIKNLRNNIINDKKKFKDAKRNRTFAKHFELLVKHVIEKKIGIINTSDFDTTKQTEKKKKNLIIAFVIIYMI
jgi:hypothetical protein